jgi:LysR family glycine cleavage system transcriptional activator
MTKRLPPLLALEAFDAAARALSFKAAALELNLTPSAISHRVKQLEQHLGLPLFRRLNREIRLTEAGEDYYATVRRAFDQVAQVSLRVGRGLKVDELRLSSVPHFAASWIIPNLEELLNRRPGLRVYVESSIRNADFARDAVDAAVRYGNGDWPGLVATRLTDLSVAPVCTPALLKRLRRPADLREVTLIHFSQFPQSWGEWLQSAGLPSFEPKHEVYFDSVSQAIDAAENGLGIALGIAPLIGPRLGTGRLVMPFGPLMPLQYGYWMTCRKAEANRPAIQLLRDWLLELMQRAQVSMKPYRPKLLAREAARQSVAKTAAPKRRRPARHKAASHGTAGRAR